MKIKTASAPGAAIVLAGMQSPPVSNELALSKLFEAAAPSAPTLEA
jgi:hypothetical protein